MVSTLLIFIFATSLVSAKDRYIVIYKSNQGFSAMNSFMNLESSRGWGLKKSLPFIQGMVLQNSNARIMEQLKNHPEVLTVEKEKFYAVPRPVNGYAGKKSGAAEIGPSPVVGDPTIFSATASTPWGIAAVRAPEAWLASGDAGSRSRVLVLDTGLESTHTAVSTNFEKGRNFTGDDLSVLDENVKDNVGHGTHCSATAAGIYNATTGFTGVAPRSKILMGKVCEEITCIDPNDEMTCSGGCGSVSIAMGINWGIQEKVDVISMSLGGGASTLGEQAAVRAAEKAGIFVIAASGNEARLLEDGTVETPGVSFPAALPTVFAVGAVDSDLIKSEFSNWGPELDVVAPGSKVLSAVPTGSGRELSVDLVISGKKIHVKSAPFSGAVDVLNPVTGELVYASFGRIEDFSQMDAHGKFALISRGEISFTEKVQNALAAGAAGAIVFNNAAGLIEATLGEGGKIKFPIGMIEQSEGLKIVNRLAAGKVVGAEIKTLITDYSAWDGTSMAAPHAAGVAALAISAYKASHAGKRIKPAALRRLLRATSFVVASSNLNNEYGAGVIQADGAVKAAMAAP